MAKARKASAVIQAIKDIPPPRRASAMDRMTESQRIEIAEIVETYRRGEFAGKPDYTIAKWIGKRYGVHVSTVLGWLHGK